MADKGFPGFNDKRGGYQSGSKPVSQLPKIPPRDRKPREITPYMHLSHALKHLSRALHQYAMHTVPALRINSYADQVYRANRDAGL